MNTNSKLRVALFFGGVSSEHDVSCVSASAWLRALGQKPCADKYEVFPVGITKDGQVLPSPAVFQFPFYLYGSFGTEYAAVPPRYL